MTIGERIKSRRNALGISADTLAEKLGVSRSTVFRYESGYIEKLPADILAPIAEALSCTVNDLVGLVPEESVGPSTFRDNLRCFRKRANLSQAELGAFVGVSKSAIGMYESGEREPGVQTIVDLAKALGCTLNELFGCAQTDTASPVSEFQRLIVRLSDNDRLKVRGYIDALLDMEKG